MILDVGPKSIEPSINAGSTRPQTLVWNGPLGAFEMRALRPRHRRGGAGMRRSAREAGKLLSVAGGGDTVAALNHAGVGRRLHLRLDRRRRLPRMAGGQAAAGRRGAEGEEQVIRPADRESVVRRSSR